MSAINTLLEAGAKKDGATARPKEKFVDPDVTADGSPRARVPFAGLETLWINTGTLCNLECVNCYIESSPTNDRLAYISIDEAAPLIAEAKEMGAREIAFTGGEPFMNPDMIAMIEAAMAHNLSVLILTNAMRPMMRPKISTEIVRLIKSHGDAIKFRVSLDHFTQEGHDKERGPAAFDIAWKGIKWLAAEGAALSIAGRSVLSETEAQARAGYQALFDAQGLGLKADEPAHLVLFPEMDAADSDPPEITGACWGILDKDPRDIMCASSRMAVKRKGDSAASVLACTLIAYDDAFNLGRTLKEATRPVKLNHRHCATFCVLGGSNCSG